MNVGEFCNREVIVVERQESVLDAAKLMRFHHVGDVLVVDKAGGMTRPVGILTDRDIVIEIVAEAIEPGLVTAGDAMTYELVTAREEDDLMETIKIQRSKGIRRVPVVNDQGELVGILAVDDVLEIIIEQLSDLVGLVTMERRREMGTRA